MEGLLCTVFVRRSKEKKYFLLIQPEQYVAAHFQVENGR